MKSKRPSCLISVVRPWCAATILAVWIAIQLGVVGSIGQIVEQSNFTLPQPYFWSEFGIRLGISEDTIVIGDTGDSSNARGVNQDASTNAAYRSGAAYVFVREGATIRQQAFLKALNPDGGDQFGASIAISGDTIVIGANYEDGAARAINTNLTSNSATDSGAAYVFARVGTNWIPQAYLKASNSDAYEEFGGSVSISADTIVIGARGESSNTRGVNGPQFNKTAPVCGAAYVYVRNGTNWTQQAYLKASNADANDWFGSSVAVAGDTIVVGASGEASASNQINGNQNDNSAAFAGAAYVFVRSGTNWVQQAYLKPDDAESGGEFGSRVALAGDTAIVSSVQKSKVYVFVRDGTVWTRQASLRGSNTGISDWFGHSISISGATIVVGAFNEASSATGINGDELNDDLPSSGAAYVFVRNGRTWSQQAYVKASKPGRDYYFGEAVGVFEDTAVVGAWGGNTTYLFKGVGPPRIGLKAERILDSIRVSWVPAADFVLEQANGLGPGFNWSQMAVPYQTNGTTISVTFPLSPGPKYFRLRQP